MAYYGYEPRVQDFSYIANAGATLGSAVQQLPGAIDAKNQRDAMKAQLAQQQLDAQQAKQVYNLKLEEAAKQYKKATGKNDDNEAMRFAIKNFYPLTSDELKNTSKAMERLTQNEEKYNQLIGQLTAQTQLPGMVQGELDQLNPMGQIDVSQAQQRTMPIGRYQGEEQPAYTTKQNGVEVPDPEGDPNMITGPQGFENIQTGQTMPYGASSQVDVAAGRARPFGATADIEMEGGAMAQEPPTFVDKLKTDLENNIRRVQAEYEKGLIIDKNGRPDAREAWKQISEAKKEMQKIEKQMEDERKAQEAKRRESMTKDITDKLGTVSVSKDGQQQPSVNLNEVYDNPEQFSLGTQKLDSGTGSDGNRPKLSQLTTSESIKVSAALTGLKQIEDLRRKYEASDPNDPTGQAKIDALGKTLGLWDATTGAFKKKTGTLPKWQADIRSQIEAVKSDIRNQLYAGNLTEGEAKRFEEQIGGLVNNPDAFKAQIDNLYNMISNRLLSTVEVAAANNRDVTKFEPMIQRYIPTFSASTYGQSAGGMNMPQVNNADMQIREILKAQGIPEADLDQAVQEFKLQMR